jgi:hypothetical protein
VDNLCLTPSYYIKLLQKLDIKSLSRSDISVFSTPCRLIISRKNIYTKSVAILDSM